MVTTEDLSVVSQTLAIMILEILTSPKAVTIRTLKTMGLERVVTLRPLSLDGGGTTMTEEMEAVASTLTETDLTRTTMDVSPRMI